MASASQPEIVYINTYQQIHSFLRSMGTRGVEGFDKRTPMIYVDAEGNNLSRNGTLSILQIYVPWLNKTFLFDITVLGNKAFTKTTARRSLKSILESRYIRKLFWDVRQDSDALYNLHGVLLKNVVDVQLHELATRTTGRQYLLGLARAIENERCGMTDEECEEWLSNKRTGRMLLRISDGGYGIFDERPLRPVILQYCSGDVNYLGKLMKIYDDRLPAQNNRWMRLISDTTIQRVKMALAPKTWGGAEGPWNWNDIAMAEANFMGTEEQWEAQQVDDSSSKSNYSSSEANSDDWNDSEWETVDPWDDSDWETCYTDESECSPDTPEYSSDAEPEGDTSDALEALYNYELECPNCGCPWMETDLEEVRQISDHYFHGMDGQDCPWRNYGGRTTRKMKGPRSPRWNDAFIHGEAVPFDDEIVKALLHPKKETNMFAGLKITERL